MNRVAWLLGSYSLIHRRELCPRAPPTVPGWRSWRLFGARTSVPRHPANSISSTRTAVSLLVCSVDGLLSRISHELVAVLRLVGLGRSLSPCKCRGLQYHGSPRQCPRHLRSNASVYEGAQGTSRTACRAVYLYADVYTCMWCAVCTNTLAYHALMLYLACCVLTWLPHLVQSARHRRFAANVCIIY